MKEIPCQCMDCRRWFLASGRIVPDPILVEVSHGLCPDCFIERTAPFRPGTLAEWIEHPRVSAEEIVAALDRFSEASPDQDQDQLVVPPVASDTPETDHALQGVWYRGDHGSAIPALCRRLERERNALRVVNVVKRKAA